jgi:hypothetical protein
MIEYFADNPKLTFLAMALLFCIAIMALTALTYGLAGTVLRKWRSRSDR